MLSSRAIGARVVRRLATRARAGVRCAALLCAFLSLASRARADKSKLDPTVGYNYEEIETPRIAAMGGATRALSNSLEALYINPANMAASRIYHIGAMAQIWPEARRQSYGAGAVDSFGSKYQLAGGVAGTYNLQDTDGIDRRSTDFRFALGYPLSKEFLIGIGGRYLLLSQNGLGPFGDSLPSSGLNDKRIVRAMSFDAGATFLPMEGLSLSVVGNNLSDPGNGFQPMSVAGAIGYGKDIFGVEADVVGDFDSWSKDSVRAMIGGEALLGDHFPLRAGYRYDQGAVSHALSGGIGYIDRLFGADIAVRRTVSGAQATAIVFGFTYHLESAGLDTGGGTGEGF
jgi:opacity protein-like surface antigen